MEKRLSKYVICIIALIMLVWIKNTVSATGEYLENNKNSVVQVVMVYTADDGKRFVLQSGTGLVINSNTVLTNYHLVHISSKNLKKAKDYVSKNSSDTEFSGEEEMQIAIVKKDDVLINAEIAQESQEKDFAIMTLTEETDCSPAVFGNSDVAVVAENVVAIGYPSTKPFSKEGAQLFAATDVNLIAGVVAEAEPQSIKVSGKISSGNSGGALIDGNTGELIGLLTYNKEDEKKECFKAIPVNEIKYPHLEGIVYSDNSVASAEESTTEELTEAQKETLADKAALNDCVEKALKLDQSAYTSESYLILISCLQQAQQVQYNEQATQAEVDDAHKILQQSMDNLEVMKETNWILIVGIIIGVILIIGAIVVTIIVLFKASKQKKEQSQFKVLPDMESHFNQPNVGYKVSQQTTATQENFSQRTNQETTLLNMAGINTGESNKATTLLNAAPVQMSAYLIRKKTGERKSIDSVEFTVGKDEARADYFIRDSETISRCHMKIIKRGVSYYLMDLGSTNYTYLNDECLSTNQEQAIKNGDRIKAADEEFTFEIM